MTDLSTMANTIPEPRHLVNTPCQIIFNEVALFDVIVTKKKKKKVPQNKLIKIRRKGSHRLPRSGFRFEHGLHAGSNQRIIDKKYWFRSIITPQCRNFALTANRAS
jgi:dUTPase